MAKKKKVSKKKASKVSTRAATSLDVVGVSTTVVTGQEVIAAVFRLSVALFDQSQDRARWSDRHLQVITDERRETSTLIQVIEAPGSWLWTAKTAELKPALDKQDEATKAVRNALGPVTLERALLLVNIAQTALGGPVT